MMNIKELVSVLQTPGLRPAEPMATEGLPPMVFACSLASNMASESECDAAAGGHCPTDLKEFWQLTRSARLFEDITYGQWGLEVFSPEDAKKRTRKYVKERPADVAEGDLTVGQFIGDSDLLLVRCDSRATDFGAVIVVGPIDPRVDWYTVADSFGEFLRRYIETCGEMYWVQSG